MAASSAVVRLLISAGVLLGLVITGTGLVKIIYIERTPDAVANVRMGNLFIAAGCVVLIMCAAAVFGIGPRWAAFAVAAPAVACGGLALVAAHTLLPQIVALPTFVLAIIGTVGILGHLG